MRNIHRALAFALLTGLAGAAAAAPANSANPSNQPTLQATAANASTATADAKKDCKDKYGRAAKCEHKAAKKKS